MNVLVAAGNTQTPVDRVRCITNVFSGRTGSQVAAAACDRGHAVTLLTSRPDVLAAARPRGEPDWRVRSYQTFDDLERPMAEEVSADRYDAIVHAAAVNDYLIAGVLVRRDGAFVDVAAGKVRGDHPELWLRLVPAPKLVDKVRTEWGFRGLLVKFKLEVGRTDDELLAVAERSRTASAADLMAANTLEGMHDWSLVGAGNCYRRVARPDLARALVGEVERLHAGLAGDDS